MSIDIGEIKKKKYIVPFKKSESDLVSLQLLKKKKKKLLVIS